MGTTKSLMPGQGTQQAALERTLLELSLRLGLDPNLHGRSEPRNGVGARVLALP